METSDPNHSVYPLCRIFWYQSKFHGGLASPHQCYQKILQILNRLGRSESSWFNFRLELQKKYVDIYMPGYIPTTLHKLQQKPPARPQDAPHPWNKPVYGNHIQLSTQKRSVPILNSADKNRVQSINGTFIYYSWAVDPTMIPALNEISTCQSAPTQ